MYFLGVELGVLFTPRSQQRAGSKYASHSEYFLSVGGGSGKSGGVVGPGVPTASGNGFVTLIAIVCGYLDKR